MPSVVGLVEGIFDVVYLLFAWSMFLLIFNRYRKLKPERRHVSGWIMVVSFTLAFGDSFHLIPRSYEGIAAYFGHPVDLSWWLGFGMAASSFTLAFFYLALAIYARRKFTLRWNGWLGLLMIACMMRLSIIFYPMNGWFGSPEPGWKFYRNLPFLVQGIGVIVLFLRHADELPKPQAKLVRGTAYAIIASFAFYTATLIGTEWAPLWGSMMLPKTVAYMVAIWLLYRLEFGSDCEGQSAPCDETRTPQLSPAAS